MQLSPEHPRYQIYWNKIVSLLLLPAPVINQGRHISETSLYSFTLLVLCTSRDKFSFDTYFFIILTLSRRMLRSLKFCRHTRIIVIITHLTTQNLCGFLLLISTENQNIWFWIHVLDKWGFFGKYKEKKWKHPYTRVKLIQLFYWWHCFWFVTEFTFQNWKFSLLSWELLIFGMNYNTICFNFS